MDWLKRIHKTTDPRHGASVRTGDQVRVWYRIQEKGRVRTALFEGIVLRVRGPAATRTLTVRRVTFGEGVERVFPLDSPIVERVELLRRGKVRRSRLYFLRTIIGKSRIASTDVSAEEAAKQGGATKAESIESNATPTAADQPREDAQSA